MSSPTTAKGIFADGVHPDRDEYDLYETPRSFTRAMLDREKFHTDIWEPAAGKGAIVDVLESRGHKVRATDLIYRPEYPRAGVIDFLNTSGDGVPRDIITNPPFSLLSEFAEQAWELCHQKFAFVMSLGGLNSKGRHDRIYSKMTVSKIMLAGKGQEIITSKGPIKSQFTHVWVIFDKLHQGPTQFEWLPNVTYKGSEK